VERAGERLGYLRSAASAINSRSSMIQIATPPPLSHPRPPTHTAVAGELRPGELRPGELRPRT
jgi:hypothetical protein